MGNLKLTSSAFSDGGEIPRECGYKNGNKEPPLAVNGIPEKTDTLVLIMDDPDAMGAVGKVWLHWLLWDIIPNTTILAAVYVEYTLYDGTDAMMAQKLMTLGIPVTVGSVENYR